MAETAGTNDQLLLAARLYYDDQLPQERVAKLVNVSQAKVSRMLALARQRGIVRITVQPYDARHRTLEHAVQKALDVKSAIVIKTAPQLMGDELRRAIGHFAAGDVAKMIPAGARLAVAGGRTVREMVRCLEPVSRDERLTVLQAMGNVDATVGPYDALELARTIAQRFGGECLMLNTPAFVPDRKTRDAFLALAPIRAVKQRLTRATVALIGIGTLEDSVFVERGALNRQDRDRLKRAGAIGEICGRFFNARGKECDTPFRSRVISIELDGLRKVPQVIGVVAGPDRSAAIAAAVRGGLLKSLVIDESGAASLVRHLEGKT